MRINEKTIALRNLEIDEKEFKGFVKYLNDFYGVKGVYPNKYKKNLEPRDILKAIDAVASKRPKHQWDWDSLDRELVRDELIDMKKFDYPTQEAAIKEISEVGKIYEEVMEEGILQDREKKLKELPMGAKVSGGGYGPFKKTGRNTFKSPKGVLSNSEALIKLIGGFSDFKIDESVNEGKKVFKVNPQIGKAKYSISSHDGVKKNKDGSDFFDIETFKNKVDLEKAIKDYTSKGFKMESVNEIQYKDAVAKFNDELIKHPMVKKAAQHYKKTPVEIVKILQQRLSTKGNRGGDTKEVSIDFKDTTSGITIKHNKKFNESVNEIKKGSVVIPYAMDKDGEFIVDKVFKNKNGETSYTGKFKKNGEHREFILHSKDRIVKESFENPLEGLPQQYKDLLKKLQRSNVPSVRSKLIDKMNVIRKGLKLKPLTNDYKESVNEDFKAVVGKKIYSNGSGKLFFGYEKEDDSVHLVDYNTWKKLTAKNLSNEFMANRLINAIVKGQKQFNKKVDYNMWSNKTKPSFEQRMDWFMKNGWINNINKGGIKE
jgi:hypothetical protein